MIPGLANKLSLAIEKQLFESDLFPFDKTTPADKRRKMHMKYALYNTNSIQVSPTMTTFELGNKYAEENTPHYHILEDSKIIANPYQGTAKSRGSQSRVRSVGKRDYSKGSFDSTGNLIQEYRESFGAGRRSYDKIGDKIWKKESDRKKFETQNKFRYNIHYAYIERILEKHLPIVASSLGIRLYSGKATIVPERKAGYMDIKDLVALFHQSGD
jgi:hypothetical protein